MCLYFMACVRRSMKVIYLLVGLAVYLVYDSPYMLGNIVFWSRSKLRLKMSSSSGIISLPTF